MDVPVPLLVSRSRRVVPCPSLEPVHRVRGTSTSSRQDWSVPPCMSKDPVDAVICSAPYGVAVP